MKERHSAIENKLRALCRHIESHATGSDSPLSLADLGREAGISPYYLQRTFKSLIGVTPREYADACRLKALKGGLRDRPPVTEAIHAAGFGSSSRVYERASGHLGMTPGQYRKGGEDVAISYAFERIALGVLMMAATDRGLCSVQLGESAEALLEQLTAEFPRACLTPTQAQDSGQFRSWMQALADHLDRARPLPGLPLDIRGTAFQVQVWQYLMRIPAGEVRSYTQVAQAIGRPAAVRAVASACARNSLAIVVPCHRVIRGDGGLGGYRWGLARKRTLLKQERAAPASSPHKH